MGKGTQQPPTNRQKSFDALVTQANEAAKAQKIKNTILGGTDDTVTFGGYSYGARGFGKAAKEGNWSNWSLPTDMLARAYDEQDAGEMMKEMGIGFTKQLAAGFLDSIGAWSASNITQSNYRNGEIEYNNWFNNLGSKLRKSSQEENQVYQDPNGSMWNGAYWANQVQQLGYTGGIIAEMLVENLALDAVTGGTAAAGSVASKAGLLGRVGKDALFGMSQGIKEAHMNALETQNNVFQKFVQAGYSEDEALEKSKEAARLHFKTESGALMAMNAVQNVMFLGSLSRAVRGRGVDTAFSATQGFRTGFSDAFDTVGNKLVGRLTGGIQRGGLRKGLNRAAGVSLLAGSESIEEGIQTAIGKYSANTVEGKDTSWSDLWQDNEMRDSMIGGALGGLLMGAGFKAVANYRNRDFNKNYKNFLQDTLNSSKQAFENEDAAYNEYKAAEQAYTNSNGENTAENTEARANYERTKLKYQQAQEASHLVNAVNALRFDHAKRSGSTVAFDMYTQHMEDVLGAVQNQDTEALQNFGLIDQETGKERFEGSLKSIAESYEGRIQDAQKLKELYSETLNRTTGDFDIATPIVQNKFGIYKNNEEVKSYREDIENSYNNIKAFGQLSPQAQARLRLTDEKRGLQLNDEVKDSMYGQMRLQEIEAELAEYPTSYSAQDRRILNESGLGSAREGNMMSQFGHMVVGELIRSNEKLASQIDTMSKPSEIKKAVEERRKRYIERAKTRAEVVEAVQEAQQEDGVVSQEVQQVAEDRMNELVVQENLTQQEAELIQPVANTQSIQEPTKATDRETAEEINYALEDLQRRRQEELDKIPLAPSVNLDNNPETQKRMDAYQKEVDRVNAKYDELANTSPEQQAQNDVFNSRQGGTELLNNINKMVSNLDNFYERAQARQSNLRDFIHEMIHHVGLDGVKKNYSNLTKAYDRATGRDVSSSQSIYNDIYQLPSQILEDLSEDQVNDFNEQVETQVKDNLGKKETNTDGDVKVISIDEDRRTNSPNLKAAHNYQVSQRDSNGEWVVTEDNLRPLELVNNLYALDPSLIAELYNNNTELEVRPVDDNSATVSIYTSGGERQTMTWGMMKSRIGSNREAWFNNVPMVAYLGDTPLFTIHSPMWYNESNISEKDGKDVQAQVIRDGVSNITDLRQRIANGENKIKISDYRFGNVDKINEHINKEARTILEATGGTSTLAVVTASAQGKEFMISGTESLSKRFPNSVIVDSSLLDKLKPGELIEFREIGIDKTSGKTMLFPARVLNYSPLAEGNMKQDLQEGIFNNIKYSTLAYLLFENQNNEAIRVGVEQQFNFNLTDAEDLRSQILRGTGIDIKFQAGDYVNLFLQNTRLSDRGKQDMTYFENTDYLSKSKNRQIQGLDFFFNDEKTFTIGKVDSGYENALLRNVGKFFNDSEGQGALVRKSKFSVNKKGLGDSSFMIPQVDNNGRVQGEAQSYTDFAKSNLYTNLLSHEIETISGERKWITDIQPMIYFESLDSKGNSVPDTQAESNPILPYEIDVNDQAGVTSESLDINLRQQLLDAGLSEDDIKIMIANGTLGVTSDSIFESRLVPSDTAVQVFDALSTNKISSLSEQEHKDLVQSLKNNIISNLDFTKKIYLADVARAASSIVEDTIVPIMDQTRSRIANLSKVPTLAPFVVKEQAYLDKLQTIINEKEKLIRFTKQVDESGNVLEVGDIIREFNRLLGTRVEELDELNTEEYDSETTDQVAYEAEEENYSKSALEKNVKLSFTNELRLKLLGIPLQKSVTREAVLNTLGLPQYNSADEVLLKLQEITTSVRSDWSQVMDKLEQRYAETKKPIYIQIRDQFKNLEEHIQNQLLHKLIQEPVTLYKVLISEETETDSQGQSFVTNTTTTILDENSSRESLTLAKQLQNDFVLNQNNNLGYVVSDSNSNKRLDLDYTRSKQEQLQKLVDANLTKNNIPVREVNQLFNEYGLYRIKENAREKYISEANPFEAKRGILYFINEQLKDLIQRENEARAKDSNLDMSLRENSIFAKANSALKKLINTEISLNGSDVAKSIRVDGKTLQGASNTTMIQDTLNDIKDPTGRLGSILRQAKLSQDNFILKLLLEDESFRKNTQLSWTSPDFIKKHNRDNFSSAEIDSLGQLDYFSSILATYSNQKGFSKLTNSDSLYRGLKFRLAQMTTTTFADKGRMMLWTTAVVDAQRGQIEFDPSGSVRLNPILGGFLFEQLFKPEFNRIVESYQMSKNGAPSNIIGYDAASKVFLGLPMFNNLTITLDGQEINILTAIDKGLVDPERYRQGAIDALQNMLTYNLDKKINKEGNKGILVDIGMFNPNTREIEKQVESRGETGTKKIKESPFKNVNDAFINNKPGENDLDRFRFAMIEFEINTLLNQNNIYSLFLGDQAFYSKDKFVKNAIKSGNFSDLSEAISLIIDKRAAMLIAPGAKYANSEVKGLQDIGTQYHQIFVNDVEGISNYIDRFLESQYGEMTESQKNLVTDIKRIDTQVQEKYDLFGQVENIPLLEQQINDLLDEKDNKVNELSKTAPDIADYFNITGTDAQEYSTWRSHLDALYRKGDLTTQERDMVKSAYDKLSAGNFSEVSKEEYAIVMQPLKTVYTGTINYTNPTTGAVLARPIYIKSSTIPLLPHVTQGLKLDEVRKKLEAFENKKGTLVKMSYQTANKIGATKTRLTMNDLYYKSFDSLFSQSEDTQGNLQERGLLADSMVTLPTTGLRIQQETPYKQGKYFAKGEDPHISMGSQFMKVIMGNGINKMGNVFTTQYFNSTLLEAVGLDPNNTNLDGKGLESIYTKVYQEYSNVNKQILFDEFGIDPSINFTDLSADGQFEVLSNLVKVLENEIDGRGYPDYMQDSLVVLKEEILKDKEAASLNMPLLFDSNANKFESLMQSIVSNRLISHKLPGNGHISASSEGFSRKTTLDAISASDRSGIVWINGPVNDLSPTYIEEQDGRKILVKSKVLIPSHFAYTDRSGNRQYVDFTSDEYSEAIVENGQIVGRRLRAEKIEPELLNMFAFRIPTSSHQSGTLIEVAGFLPSTMGDSLVVPKEHTTQLGEDYDIDKRYVYKNNYFVDRSGVIRKTQYTQDTITPEDSRSRRLTKNKERLLGLENGLIDVYKTVFSSTDTTVQKKVYKPLVTEIADKTANLIQAKQRQDSTENRDFFTNLSDEYQYYLMKLGADGKGAIGQHSNGVTMQAQFDRAENKVRLLSPNGSNRVLKFGNIIESDGILGNSSKAINSEYDVADQHGENQNVGTDNINKQIMIKRNENSYTMSVYATMAFRKIYTTPERIRTGLFEKGKEIIADNLSLPSLFMSQPILVDYVKLRAKYDSITGDFMSKKDIDDTIVETLSQKYGFGINRGQNGSIDILDLIDENVYQQGQSLMTGQRLFDNITESQALKNPSLQAAVLQHFYILLNEAETLQKYNALINLSTSKLGVSNFNNIQRINLLNDIAYGETPGIENIESLIGKSVLTDSLSIEDKANLKEQGYIEVGLAMWLPQTIEGTMLINSLQSANNVVETLFPYRSGFVENTVNTIFENNDKDPNKKSAAGLEWKYEIMNSMRDFMYTLKSANMFTDVDAERQRLFMDNGVNKSLASIINALKIDNNDIILNNALLRDLEVTVRYDGLPSLIQHFAASNESFDKSVKYEAFKNLLADNVTSLGTFNSEEYTPRKLAFDLAAYSYMADTQRGASSFRNYIHYSFLEQMGITKGMRKIYYALQNENVEGIMPLFIEQYFQHNPNKASIMSAKTYDWHDFKEMNSRAKNAKSFERALQSLDSFVLNDLKSGKNRPEFISVRDTSQSVNNKNKKFKLFKRGTDGVYNMIDVLGDTGFNEYNANQVRSKSKETILIKDLRAQETLKTNNLVAKEYADVTKQALVNLPVFKPLHTVQGVIDSFLAAESFPKEMPALYNFLNQAKDILYTDIPIVFENTRGNALGEYQANQDRIVINPAAWEMIYNRVNGDIVKARTALRELFIEEIIHANTVKEFRKYVESEDRTTGVVTLKSGAPAFANRLVALYESVRDEVPYDPSDISTYYSKDIYEFMAGMFVAEDYRQRVESKSPGIVQRFLDALRNLFRSMYTNKTGETLDYKSQMFNDVRELIKTYSESLQVKPEVSQQENVDYNDMLDNNPGEDIMTRDDLLSQDDFDGRQKFTNFAEEAFRCK